MLFYGRDRQRTSIPLSSLSLPTQTCCCTRCFHLLGISALATPVPGIVTEAPPLPRRQIFHYYEDPQQWQSQMAYMRKLRGFWQTEVKIKGKAITYIVYQDPTSFDVNMIKPQFVGKNYKKIFSNNIWTLIPTLEECTKYLSSDDCSHAFGSSYKGFVVDGSLKDRVRFQYKRQPLNSPELDTLEVYSDSGGDGEWMFRYKLKVSLKLPGLKKGSISTMICAHCRWAHW
ncbi:hypothetical protein AX14_010223 [Amanita brunnescens Koide BX004]|nr:hypothetical protein AX14_010223 [Amanita brunnescens Koide BX004]